MDDLCFYQHRYNQGSYLGGDGLATGLSHNKISAATGTVPTNS